MEMRASILVIAPASAVMLSPGSKVTKTTAKEGL
jgi:hypothetical protein